MRFSTVLCAAALAMPAAAMAQAQPGTVRVDYVHSGNANVEHYALERVLIEPLPWAGSLSQAIDTTDRGINKVEVVDAKTGKLLYSRGFSTIFGEWRTTEEAERMNRGVPE